MSDHQKFESNIPPALLETASPTEKWLMEEMSKNTQATEWLLHKREEDSKKLDELDKKLSFTNGKIANAIIQINSLEQDKKVKEESWTEINKIISIKKFIGKYLINKYALVFIGIFIFGCVKVAISPEIRELLAKIIGLG